MRKTQIGRIARRARGERVGTVIADLTVCGAVAPYNSLAAGKLVGALAVSPTVLAAYRAKYSRPSEIASAMAGRPITREARLAFVGYHIAVWHWVEPIQPVVLAGCGDGWDQRRPDGIPRTWSLSIVRHLALLGCNGGRAGAFVGARAANWSASTASSVKASARASGRSGLALRRSAGRRTSCSSTAASGSCMGFHSSKTSGITRSDSSRSLTTCSPRSLKTPINQLLPGGWSDGPSTVRNRIASWSRCVRTGWCGPSGTERACRFQPRRRQ